MIFEWDERKREEVYEKHGVDFELMTLVFADENMLVAEDTRRDYGEPRYNGVGKAPDGNCYHVTFTVKGDIIRLITAWRLNERSRQYYEARYAGGDEGEA